MDKYYNIKVYLRGFLLYRVILSGGRRAASDRSRRTPIASAKVSPNADPSARPRVLGRNHKRDRCDYGTYFSPAFSAASLAVALQSASSIPRAITVSI